VLLFVVALTACSDGSGKSASSSSTQASSSPTAPTSAPAPVQPNFLNGEYACSLITQAEMSTVFGRPSRPPEPNGGRLGFDGGDISHCRIVSEDGELIVQYGVFRGHTADVTQTHWTNTIGPPGNIPTLPGVGDQAVFVQSTNGGDVYALHQFETLTISIVATNIPGADPQFDTLPLAIEAARIIAARMGSNASSISECAVGADGLVPEGQRLSADDLAFEASQDEGKYSGTWKNDTFGTDGTVEADVAFDLQARKVTIKFQFKGDTLGIQGDGLTETAVIEVDRPVAHVRSNTLGDLVITRPLGRACPQRPTSVAAGQPSNSSLSGVNASIQPGDNIVDATFDITYPNGKTSTGSFILRHQ
jgi:hypothetical protein